MADKLSIRDLQYIKPAVIYGCKVERWLNRSGKYAWYWDGDPMFPCRVGTTMEKMVRMGFMERVDVGVSCYRRTDAGYSLICRSCHGKGEHYDDDGQVTGECTRCNGLGLTIGTEHHD